MPLSGDEEYRLARNEGIAVSLAEFLFACAFADPDQSEVVKAATGCPIEFVLSGMPAWAQALAES